MQQSNGYIITYAIVLTMVIGLLLSGTAELLGPTQQKAIALDTKKQILGAVVEPDKIAAMSPDEINEYYENSISSVVVNIDGEEVEEQDGAAVTAESVDIGKNYKKPAEDRLYPVFIFHEEGNTDEIVAYILPIYGSGLWDAIWGYLALQTDMDTIEGITFAHAKETPGLGARITENGVQNRYRGKKVWSDDNEIESVVMQKGEGRDYSNDPHKVDGLSGSTITAVGVNNMLKNYLGHYRAYMEKVKSGSSSEVAEIN